MKGRKEMEQAAIAQKDFATRHMGASIERSLGQKRKPFWKSQPRLLGKFITYFRLREHAKTLNSIW